MPLQMLNYKRGKAAFVSTERLNVFIRLPMWPVILMFTASSIKENPAQIDGTAGLFLSFHLVFITAILKALIAIVFILPLYKVN